MGLSLAAVHLIGQRIGKLGQLREKKLLTIGVQDCHFTYDELIRHLGKHGIPHQTLTQSDIRLTTGFKWAPSGDAHHYRGYIHQETLFRVLGFNPENMHALDISNFEGADVVHDLNEPIPDRLAAEFDVVIESGTIEHVFSLKDAMFNLMALCKVGGTVCALSPVDQLSHGFVNVNAELFRDAFTTNGFAEVSLTYLGIPVSTVLAKRFFLRYSPERLGASLRPFFSTLVFGAYRRDEEKALVVPQQGFYRKLWHLEDATSASGSGLAMRLPLAVREWIGGTPVHTGLMVARGERVRL